MPYCTRAGEASTVTFKIIYGIETASKHRGRIRFCDIFGGEDEAEKTIPTSDDAQRPGVLIALSELRLFSSCAYGSQSDKYL